MKSIVVVVALMALVFAGCSPEPQSDKPKGVRMGATVEEVEAALGPAVNIIPQFGDEMRVYKAASGRVYTIRFNGEGKVFAIDWGD